MSTNFSVAPGLKEALRSHETSRLALPHGNAHAGAIDYSDLHKRFRLRTRIRFAGHYWHLPLLLHWLGESSIAITVPLIVARLFEAGPLHAILWSATAAFASALIVSMVGMGLFSRRQRGRKSGLVLRISICVLAASGFAAWWNHSAFQFSVTELGVSALVAWALLVLARTVWSRLIDGEILKRRVLVLGVGHAADRIRTLRRRSDQRTFKIVGYVAFDNEPAVVPNELVLPFDSLTRIAAEYDVDEIVVAMDDRRCGFPTRALLDCRLAGIDVTEMITFLEHEAGRIHLDLLQPSWLIFSTGFRHDLIRHCTERSFDIFASALLLLFAAPVMLVTAAAIKLEDGWSSPVFYRQQRVGFLGRVFNIVKFRSMCVDAEPGGKACWARVQDRRVTRVGAIIRRLRIDELPQLFNVLHGKMSFVGPRPERPEFVKQFADSIPYYQERHAIKPGLTGWAQLCYPYGASEKDAREKLQLDLFYVKHHSLLFDLAILLETVEIVLLGKGAR